MAPAPCPRKVGKILAWQGLSLEGGFPPEKADAQEKDTLQASLGCMPHARNGSKRRSFD